MIDPFFRKGRFNQNKYYKAFLKKTNYSQAEKTCAETGGALAMGYKSEDNVAIEWAYSYSIIWTDFYGFWTAGTDRGSEGFWRMPDGISIDCFFITIQNMMHKQATSYIPLKMLSTYPKKF